MQLIDPASLAQLVIDSTRSVFSAMLDMDVTAGDSYVEHGPPELTEGVVALIGLAGSWVGTGALSCSASFACRISARMLMAEFESVGEDVLDAFAEVTNMVIGNVKTGLEEHLGPMGLSVPTVVQGKDFTARSAGEGEWTVYPFFSGEDRLEVKIRLVPSRKPVVHSRQGHSHPQSSQG